jgi:trans-aconitate methyltransferase
MADAGVFQRMENGILLPERPVRHRDEEYDPAGFDMLRRMQARHFWYLGRHRFLLSAVKRFCPLLPGEAPSELQGIDLGGGCGGWIRYLQTHAPHLFSELALADSSLSALAHAVDVVGPDITRYQIDLCRLTWTERWDVAFLLDVLEHIPEDVTVLQGIHDSLRPGGLLFVTTPALKFFWTYNDDLAHHIRRYSRRDFADLAKRTGFQLRSSRYFMFLLSPLLLLSRWKAPNLRGMSEQAIREHMRQTHRVPVWPVNQALKMIFSLESPLGVWLPFPWGTSILAVLQKPPRVCSARPLAA